MRRIAARIESLRAARRSAADAMLPNAWRGVVRRRVVVAASVFGVWMVAIEAKLIHLQVVQHDMLVERAGNQQRRIVKVHPKRGEILDRNGRVLAYSVDADTVYAVPHEIDDPVAAAQALCDVFDDCGAAELEGLEERLRAERAFVYVRRKVSPAAARRVAALDLDGVGFRAEDRRYYPNRELAAHVVGYVGLDNQGLGGIESTYDSELTGNAGHVLIQTDARQRVFGRNHQPPTPAASIELTIDENLQHIVERELREGVRAHEAEGGVVVLLDPRNAEILAMASEPSFNPNAFAAATDVERRNRAVQDQYEPGSTFKVVTAAAAFEEDVVDRDEIFDVSAGYIRIGRDRIPDFTTYGPLSFTDVIVKSSNVGAILVGLRLGPERLSRYVQRFGFGRAHSPDLPSEHPGLVWGAHALDDRAIASISMGYQVAVTPLQMATAIAAVANGGELLRPRVVRAVIRNDERVPSERVVIRQAISRETAAQLTEILTAVTERGTARAARVSGYPVAGKTGTAEKLIDGRYAHDQHYASFVGFVPADAPRLVMLVGVDNPKGDRYTGGAVAAPIFRRIAEAALRYLRVPRSAAADRPALAAVRRPPEPAAPVPASGVVAAAALRDGVMPDLRGMSARQAARSLAALGLRAAFVGDGAVLRHAPPGGAAVEPGAAATVWLHRRAPLRGGGEEAAAQ